MKKVWAWIVGALTVLVGALVAALRIQSLKAADSKADAERAKAAADHSAANAQALTEHLAVVGAIKRAEEFRDERIKNGESSTVLADIVAANNHRVPNDGRGNG
jgi:ABC-type siderophore export system fused ATPase/permease subunit